MAVDLLAPTSAESRVPLLLEEARGGRLSIQTLAQPPTVAPIPYNVQKLPARRPTGAVIQRSERMRTEPATFLLHGGGLLDASRTPNLGTARQLADSRDLEAGVSPPEFDS